MQITIDIKELLDPSDDRSPFANEQVLYEAVVERLAQMLLDKTDASCRDRLRSKAAEAYEREIAAQISGKVTEVINEPFQRYKPWGDKVGEPTTVREMLREKLDEWLKSTKRRSRDSYRNQEDPYQSMSELLEDAAAHVMSTELKAEITKARVAVGNAIRDKALKAAVAALKPESRD